MEINYTEFHKYSYKSSLHVSQTFKKLKKYIYISICCYYYYYLVDKPKTTMDYYVTVIYFVNDNNSTILIRQKAIPTTRFNIQ